MTDNFDDKPITADCGHRVASWDETEECQTPEGLKSFCLDCTEYYRSEGRLP
jgi:hypothetical protein